MTSLVQIDWSDINYSVEEYSRTIYTFPVHIRVLILVILIFVLCIFILLTVILGSRVYKTRREQKQEQLKQKYQAVFMNYLFEGSGEIPANEGVSLFDPEDLKNTYSRDILLNEIIHLHKNFTGETAHRLESLYIKLSFQLDSLLKLKSRRWYIVAKGMRELAHMNVKDAVPEMMPFLNSKNEILRMETRISVMKLSDQDPLSFLALETEILSEWDQANIYAMLSRMPDMSIPDFSLWLNSPNRSVVLFCISMIGSFRQQQSIPVLIRMLDEEIHHIRIAVIRALRNLSATGAEEKLISLYPLLDPETKNEILKTLGAIGKEPSAALMEQVLRQPVTDYPLSIQAVRSLLTTARNGQQRLENIMSAAGPKLQLIIRHASDPRM